MPGPSAPLQTGQPGSISWVNAMHTLDSRQQMPSSWDEVYLLQEALQPSIRSFTSITARSPPVVPGSPWLPYASQLDILQRESSRVWSADRRPGASPRLAELAAWTGGISAVGKAGFHITEEMTEEFMHAKLREFRHRDGSLGWHQAKFVQQEHDKFQSILWQQTHDERDLKHNPSREQDSKMPPKTGHRFLITLSLEIRSDIWHGCRRWDTSTSRRTIIIPTLFLGKNGASGKLQGASKYVASKLLL